MRGMSPSYRAQPCPASRTGSLSVSPSVTCRFFRQSLSEDPGLFRPQGVDETKRDANETISGIGEDIRKLAMVTDPPNERRAANWAWRPHHRGLSMIKALSAIAVAACVAAALTLLPGFAPTVEASVPQPLAKGDRLDIKLIGKDCSQQAWPNFDASCLRRAGTKADVRQARLVTVD